MKRYSLIILSMLIVLTGCIPKSSFLVTFDGFTIKLYDNNKKYDILPWDTSIIDMKILAEMKEQIAEKDTGFVNSFIIARTAIQSWTSMKTLVESNMSNLGVKLFKYKSLSNANKKVKCDDLQYSWYITTFSYQLGNQTLYGWQYFLADEALLYILSLSSDKQKDIKAFIKSIGTIKCIN